MRVVRGDVARFGCLAGAHRVEGWAAVSVLCRAVRAVVVADLPLGPVMCRWVCGVWKRAGLGRKRGVVVRPVEVRGGVLLRVVVVLMEPLNLVSCLVAPWAVEAVGAWSVAVVVSHRFARGGLRICTPSYHAGTRLTPGRTNVFILVP